MKINLLLAIATFFSASAFAQPLTAQNQISGFSSAPTSKEAPAPSFSQQELNLPQAVDAAFPPATENLNSVPLEDGLFGQDKPRKARKGDSKDQSKKGEPEVKEVATAKRQEKPRKVSEEDVNTPRERVTAGRPQSAARPGRGAGANVSKVTGNVSKAAKAVKPVKVGVGRIKVGKN